MYTVSLPVIVIRRSRLVILILLFLLAGTLLYYFIALQEDMLLSTMTIVVSLVLSSFVWMQVATYRKTGVLTIMEDHITVVHADNTVTAFPLQTVNDLVFRYNGYAGKPYGIKSPYLMDGTDNTICINGKEYTLLVEWEQISTLNSIFAAWRERGVPFELYSSGKRTVKLERLLSA